MDCLRRRADSRHAPDHKRDSGLSSGWRRGMRRQCFRPSSAGQRRRGPPVRSLPDFRTGWFRRRIGNTRGWCTPVHSRRNRRDLHSGPLCLRLGTGRRPHKSHPLWRSRLVRSRGLLRARPDIRRSDRRLECRRNSRKRVDTGRRPVLCGTDHQRIRLPPTRNQGWTRPPAARRDHRRHRFGRSLSRRRPSGRRSAHRRSTRPLGDLTGSHLRHISRLSEDIRPRTRRLRLG